MKLSKLCETISQAGFPATLYGDDITVCAVNTLEEARPGEISFLSNPKYASAIAGTRASAIVTENGIETPPAISAIRCDNPYAAITVAIIAIHGHRLQPQWGVSEQATIDPSAKIGTNPNIAAGATIAANATIGDNCTIYPGCYVADGATLGDDCTLYPNVVIYDRCQLGNRVTVHACSVIGEDGLGYAPHGENWIKIPQIGIAILGDDVEIGANCSIDRATLGETTIGAGTKFSNNAVIGHGTKIGPNCMFVGQVGVAGSATIGGHVTLGGQVGVGGHLEVGDDVQVAGQSGIHSSVAAGEKLFGSPAMPLARARRALNVVKQLPEWTKRIKELERQIKELRDKVGCETVEEEKVDGDKVS